MKTGEQATLGLVVRASAQSKMYVDSDSDAYHCPLNGWIQQCRQAIASR